MLRSCEQSSLGFHCRVARLSLANWEYWVEELIATHLMASPRIDSSIPEYLGPRSPEVERVSWSDDTVWIDAGSKAGDS